VQKKHGLPSDGRMTAETVSMLKGLVRAGGEEGYQISGSFRFPNVDPVVVPPPGVEPKKEEKKPAPPPKKEEKKPAPPPKKEKKPAPKRDLPPPTTKSSNTGVVVGLMAAAAGAYYLTQA